MTEKRTQRSFFNRLWAAMRPRSSEPMKDHGREISRSAKRNSHPRRSEAGNVFFTLFGAVAVVGVLGAGIMATMRGPLSTMVEINRIEETKAQLRVNARMILLDAATNTYCGANDDDTATPGSVEFTEPKGHVTGGGGPTGGGLMPSVGGTITDAWGMTYGYCAYNNGADNSTTCGTENYIAGGTNLNDVAIVLMSGGPDRAFDTTCAQGASNNKQGDDIIEPMTYAEAVSGSGGLWTDSGTQIDSTKALNVTDTVNDSSFGAGASFGGNLNLTSAGAIVTTDIIQAIGANTTIEILDGIDINTDLNVDGNITGGADNEVNISDSLAVTGATDLQGTLNINGVISNDAGDVSIGDNVDIGSGGTLTVAGATTLSSTLDVEGNVTGGADNILTVADGMNVTGAADFDSTLEVNGNITDSSDDIVTIDDGLQVTGTTDLDGETTINAVDTTPNTTAIAITASTDDGTTDVLTLYDSAATPTEIFAIDSNGVVSMPGGIADSNSGNIMVSNGTSFQSVSMSGDVAIASGGATTIQPLAVETGMIAADAVTSAKIDDETIESADILDGTIAVADLAATGAANSTCLQIDGTGTFVWDACGTGSGTGGASTLSDTLAAGNDGNGEDATNIDDLDVNRLFVGPGAVAWSDGSGSGGQNLEVDIDGDIGAEYYCDADGLNCFTAGSVANSSQDRIEDTGDQNTYIDTDTDDADTNNSIVFHTAGSQRMIIDSAGEIGIGTQADPTADLHIFAANPTLYMQESLAAGLGPKLQFGDPAGIKSELYYDHAGARHRTLLNVDVDADSTGEFVISGGSVLFGPSGNTPDASSLLQLDSTTQGFLPPRLTAAERTTLTAVPPATGLMIFNTDAGDAGLLQFWDGTQWVDVGGGGAESTALWEPDGTNDYIEYDDTLGGVRIGRVTGQPAPSIDWLLDVTNSVVYTTANKVAIGSSTISAGEQQLELDVTGDIGADNYCDSDGNDCFTATDVSSGAAIGDDSLDWDKFVDTMTLDATTTIDMDTNAADFNFDSDTFVIDSSANNVGIGTATPGSSKLFVADNQDANTNVTVGNIDAGASASASFIAAANGGYTGITQTSTAGGDYGVLLNSTANGLYIMSEHPTAGGIMFATGPTSATERMRVDPTGGVSIGSGANANQYSILDVASTDRGVLLPRMTTVQRDAMDDSYAATEAGMTIYNTTDSTYQFWDGSAWQSFATSAGSATALQDADPDTSIEVDTAGDGTANTIVFTNNSVETMRITAGGNVGIGTATPASELDVAGNISLSSYVKFGGTAGDAPLFPTSGTDGISDDTIDWSHMIDAMTLDATTTIDMDTNSVDMNFDGGTLFIDNDGQIGIGDADPNQYALVEMTSTTAGILLPRLTTVERDAMDDSYGATETGMTIFNTTDSTYQFWDGSAWQSFATSAGSAQHIYAPPSAPADGDISNSYAGVWLDEAANELQIKVKDSGGDIKPHTWVTLYGQSGSTCTPTINNIQSNSITAYGNSVTILNYAVPAVTSPMMVIAMSSEEDSGTTSPAISSLTFGGTSISNIAGEVNDLDKWAAVAYLVNPVGVGDIVLTMNDQVEALDITVYTLSCAVQKAPIATMTNAAGGSSNLSVNVTTAASSIIIDAFEHGASDDIDVTDGPNQVQAYENQTTTGATSTGGSSYRIESAAGTYAMGWTAASSNGQALVAAAFETFGVSFPEANMSLDQLKDVTTTGAAAGSTLIYDGTAWLAGEASGGGVIDDDEDTQIEVDTAGDGSANTIVFSNNGSESVRITATGEVGIGTASPGSALDVVGDVQVSNYVKFTGVAGGAPTYDSAGSTTISDDSLDWDKFVDTMTLDATTTIDMDTNTADLNFDGGTLFIDDDGQIGIGDTDPNQYALVEMTSTSAGVLLPRMTTVERDAMDDAYAATEAGMTIYNTTDSTYQFWDGDSWESFATSAAQAYEITDGTANDNDTWVRVAADDGSDNDTIRFAAGDGTEHMRVASTGNIGIGTTTPVSKLDVAGDIELDEYLKFGGITGDAPNYISSSGSSTTDDSLDWAQFVDAMTLDATTTIDMDTNTADLNFDGGTLFIDNDGQIGIGDTDPNQYALVEMTSTNAGVLLPRMTTVERDAMDDAYAATEAGMTIYNTTANTYQFWDGSAWQSFATSAGSATALQDADPDTSIEVDTAGDGTANTIVFTNNSVETMRITAGGNVGIGTTTPASELDVAGNISLGDFVKFGGTTGDAPTYIALSASNIADDAIDWSGIMDAMTLDATTTIDMDTNTADFNFDNGTLFIDNDGQIGIGDADPNQYALVEMTSTTAGALLPRMTTVQRDAMDDSYGATEAGMTIYNTTDSLYQFWDGDSWESIANAASTLGGLSCSTNEIVRFNGTNWICSTETDVDSRLNLQFTPATASSSSFSATGSPSALGHDIIVWNAAVTTLDATTAVMASTEAGNTYLTAYSYSGGNWTEISGSRYDTGIDVTNMDIERLSSDTVLLSEMGGGTGGIRAFRWNGSTWSLLDTAPSSGYGMATVVDSTTVVHWDSLANILRTYSWNGSTFTLDASQALTFPGGAGRLMALDSDTIAAYNSNYSGTSDRLQVYDWNGSSWVQIGSDYDLPDVNPGEYGYPVFKISSNIVGIHNGTTVYTYAWNGANWYQAGNSNISIAGSDMTMADASTAWLIEGNSDTIRAFNFSGSYTSSEIADTDTTGQLGALLSTGDRISISQTTSNNGVFTVTSVVDANTIEVSENVSTEGPVLADITLVTSLPNSLDDILDVSASAPSDGQCLVYNASSGNWVTGACDAAGNTAEWTDDGSGNIYNTDGGDVGIGAAPTEKLSLFLNDDAFVIRDAADGNNARISMAVNSFNNGVFQVFDGTETQVFLTSNDGTIVSGNALLVRDGGSLTVPLSEPSAALHFDTANRGFLAPRLDSTARDGISNPATGLMIFNTTTGTYQYNSGTPASPSWVSFASSAGSATTLQDADPDTTIEVDTAGDGTADTIVFTNNSAESMRITAVGNVGIGTATPASELDVAGNITLDDYLTFAGTAGAAAPTYVSGSSGPFDWDSLIDAMTLDATTTIDMDTNTADLNFDSNTLFIDSSANSVGIGTATPGAELDIVGDVQYTGTLTDISDIRLKTDITPLNTDDMIERIAAVDTYTFRMKDDAKGQVEYGVMAQEIEKIFPELVKTANDEMQTKSVNYVGLIAPMIEATKALKDENDALKDELNEIKSAQADILQEVHALKAHTGFGIEKADMQYIALLLLMMILGGSAVMLVGKQRQSGNKQ